MIKMLLKDFSESLDFVTSHTTRSPRKGEEEGVDYHFVTKERFEEMIKNDEFIEYEKNY